MSEPSLLADLNPEQRRAVTSTVGPLLILAGACSGKTRVLTRRVAHLLQLGTDPWHILAVTFTNKAAAEMKQRVERLAGATGSRAWISTFHSTCARILRQEITHLGYTPRFAIYDDDDQLRLIKGIVKAHGYDPARVTPRSLLRRIDRHKNRMLTLDALQREGQVRPTDPLVRVWPDYQAALKAADALDFNDLIGLTVTLFREQPAVLERWRQRFRRILVDEFQDTNRAQYLLLRLLADAHRNLAVVGDDDQSIYGFRGADINNILGFERDFPEATVVRLEQNYRSTGNILQLANALISRNTSRKEKALWTDTSPGRRVRLVRKPNPWDEARWVARTVLELCRGGYHYREMAIVYRTNATSRVFERSLVELGIPHRLVGGRKFYERREVRDMLAYLRLITNPADDAAFLRIVNVPARGVGAKTAAALRDGAVERGVPLLANARDGGLSSVRAERAVRSFVALIDEFTELARTLEPADLVIEVVERSGYRAKLQAEETDEARARLENLDELVRDARGFELPPEASAPEDRLRAWLDRATLAGPDDEIPEGGLVTLLTVHNAKGLEYPVVFVVHMMEGQFPHALAAEEADSVEEERRLAYVAFTRAKRLLYITWNVEGTQLEFVNRRGPRTRRRADPSRFILDLPLDVVEGDIPSLEPGPRIGGPRGKGEKLDTFLQHHRMRREPGRGPRRSPPESYRLLDIEDLSQLCRGCRIHHARFGLGVVRSLSRGRVLIVFDGGQPRSVPLHAGELQLVEE
ncbi:MAG: UvrD-helicase domain-containing protein [Deltaproteobacteria bacterium]|nr:UvrD-helicase domain-containing protein [Deltaproteobacteria bacterium]